MVCDVCKTQIWIKMCTVDANGKHHSFNDEPAVISQTGIKKWFRHGVLHRDGAPAQIDNLVHTYVKEGKVHRADGPALVRMEEGKELLDLWYWEGVKASIVSPDSRFAKALLSAEASGSKTATYDEHHFVILAIHHWSKDQTIFLVLVNGKSKHYFQIQPHFSKIENGRPQI